MTECEFIEKNIQMPNKRGRKKLGLSNAKYPWRMCTEINDSFVPEEQSKEKVMEAAKKFRQRNPEFKFSVMFDDSGKLRVWRVKNDRKDS